MPACLGFVTVIACFEPLQPPWATPLHDAVIEILRDPYRDRAVTVRANSTVQVWTALSRMRSAASSALKSQEALVSQHRQSLLNPDDEYVQAATAHATPTVLTWTASRRTSGTATAAPRRGNAPIRAA